MKLQPKRISRLHTKKARVRFLIHQQITLQQQGNLTDAEQEELAKSRGRHFSKKDIYNIEWFPQRER